MSALTQKEKLESISYTGFNVSEIELIAKQVRIIVNALHAWDLTNAVIASEYLCELAERVHERCEKADKKAKAGGGEL